MCFQNLQITETVRFVSQSIYFFGSHSQRLTRTIAPCCLWSYCGRRRCWGVAGGGDGRRIRKASLPKRGEGEGKKRTHISLLPSLPNHAAVEQIHGFVQHELWRKIPASRPDEERRGQEIETVAGPAATGLVGVARTCHRLVGAARGFAGRRGTVAGAGSMARRRGAGVELRLLP